MCYLSILLPKTVPTKSNSSSIDLGYNFQPHISCHQCQNLKRRSHVHYCNYNAQLPQPLKNKTSTEVSSHSCIIKYPQSYSTYTCPWIQIYRWACNIAPATRNIIIVFVCRLTATNRMHVSCQCQNFGDFLQLQCAAAIHSQNYVKLLNSSTTYTLACPKSAGN